MNSPRDTRTTRNHPSGPPMTRRDFVQLSIVGGAMVSLGLAGCDDEPNPNDPSGLGERFTYDLTELSQVDPALIGYQQVALITDALFDANDMQLGPDGKLYVAHDGAIVAVTDGGNIQTHFELDTNPQCFAFDEQGRCFVGLIERVACYDASGTRVALSEPFAGRPHLTSIAVAGGHVFVADAGNRIVHHLDDKLKMIGQIGRADDGSRKTRFVVPSPYFDVAVGPNDTVWVANTGRHRLEQFHYDGTFLKAWGKFSMGIDGFCGCCNPSHFQLLDDGRFVVAEKGLPRVKVCDAEGELLTVIAGPDAFLPDKQAMPGGLSCTRADSPIPVMRPDGKVYVLFPLTGALSLFEPKVTP